MSWCQVADVTAKVPRFIVNVPNNPQSSDIQNWIDNRASEIYSALLNRDIDPGWTGQNIATMGLTDDQKTAAAIWLRNFNIKGAVADLLNTLEASAGDKGEESEAENALKGYEKDLDRLRIGGFDGLFSAPSMVGGNGGGNISPAQSRAQAASYNPGVMLTKFREY